MTREDFLREQRIELAAFDLAAAETRAQEVEAWERMSAEIKARSAERVAEMEREKGLR